MDRCRWSRASKHETGNKISSFLEDDWGKASPRPTSLQTPLGRSEADRPIWSHQRTSRTWGWGLNAAILENWCNAAYHFMFVFLLNPPLLVFLLFLLSSFPFLIVSFPSPALALISRVTVRYSSKYSQPIWFTHLDPLTLPANDPDPGTTPCGSLTLHNVTMPSVTHGTKFPRHHVFEMSWS